MHSPWAVDFPAPLILSPHPLPFRQAPPLHVPRALPLLDIDLRDWHPPSASSLHAQFPPDHSHSHSHSIAQGIKEEDDAMFNVLAAPADPYFQQQQQQHMYELASHNPHIASASPPFQLSTHYYQPSQLPVQHTQTYIHPSEVSSDSCISAQPAIYDLNVDADAEGDDDIDAEVYSQESHYPNEDVDMDSDHPYFHPIHTRPRRATVATPASSATSTFYPPLATSAPQSQSSMLAAFPTYAAPSNEGRDLRLRSTTTRERERSHPYSASSSASPPAHTAFLDPGTDAAMGTGYMHTRRRGVSDPTAYTHNSSSSSSSGSGYSSLAASGALTGAVTATSLSAMGIGMGSQRGGPTSPSSGSASGMPRRRTRPTTSLPVPVPVPNLTKKSRGRRVPTVESLTGAKVHGGVPISSDPAPTQVTAGVAVSLRSSAGNGVEMEHESEHDASVSTAKAGKGARVYMCTVPGCGKCFARGEHLKRHVRSIHTYEKPHRCPYVGCGKDFSRHDNLGQHMRVHKDFEVGGEKDVSATRAGARYPS